MFEDPMQMLMHMLAVCLISYTIGVLMPSWRALLIAIVIAVVLTQVRPHARNLTPVHGCGPRRRSPRRAGTAGLRAQRALVASLVDALIGKQAPTPALVAGITVSSASKKLTSSLHEAAGAPSCVLRSRIAASAERALERPLADHRSFFRLHR
ncbi:hypothetical protein BRADO2749 [Bradyrhizobium sp. ORS 278]|uniref:hypothetical protein n=1 Tax=Bradyrhizobium sp. (strain ORS 278) TaxID=114615 RepID=UPI0001508735|nr:hypothetical protein [Bradyrhizobium sp. ORS 278]CAL76560.1 hypothetical protein BRADO2749 [Bradyrhizobium sp. ORS 278]